MFDIFFSSYIGRKIDIKTEYLDITVYYLSGYWSRESVDIKKKILNWQYIQNIEGQNLRYSKSTF